MKPGPVLVKKLWKQCQELPKVLRGHCDYCYSGEGCCVRFCFMICVFILWPHRESISMVTRTIYSSLTFYTGIKQGLLLKFSGKAYLWWRVLPISVALALVPGLPVFWDSSLSSTNMSVLDDSLPWTFHAPSMMQCCCSLTSTALSEPQHGEAF